MLSAVRQCKPPSLHGLDAGTPRAAVDQGVDQETLQEKRPDVPLPQEADD